MGYIGNGPYQGVLTGGNIQDGTVETTDLADGAVTTVKISDGNITAAKMHSTLDLSGKTVTLPAGVGGKVLQVVQAINTTLVQPSTATAGYWFSSGTQATITPSSTSSKILVLVQQSYFQENTGPQGLGFLIARNGTDVTTEQGFSASYQGADRVHGYHSMVYLDSPSTTSAVTYAVKAEFWTTGGDIQLQYAGTQSPSRIVLLEIAA